MVARVSVERHIPAEAKTQHLADLCLCSESAEWEPSGDVDAHRQLFSGNVWVC